MMKNLKCIACGSKVTAELQNLFDTRFGIEEVWDICRCTECGIEQTIPLAFSTELRELYEKYYNFGGEKGTTYSRLREKFLSSSIYRLWLVIDGDIAFHGKRGRGRLLDVGCNEGRGLKIYQQNGYTVEGLELNETAAAGSHEIWFNSETSRYTTVPNHSGDMPEGTLRAILKESGISPDEFLRKS